MAEVFKGKTYNLSESQLRGLANICYREQGGGEAGVRACVSHMLNYYEKYQAEKYKNPYECTIRSGWYGSYNFNLPYLELTPPAAVLRYVADVVKNGNRSIPSYVDEYDCLSDIKVASNNGVYFTPTDRKKYKKDVTKIVNVYGSQYTFYCFPDGPSGYTDAFGYISKPATEATSNSSNKTNTTATAQNNTIEKATKWMENLAANSSHGYDQAYRWGEKGDYDCSSAVITAWQTAGVPVKSSGATYTGNMYATFKKCGFKDVTSSVDISTGAGLQRGDVLLNHVHHVAMYCGNGKEVEASVNEKGTATGGKPGDQTGREILVRSYRNYPWNVVLRYSGKSSVTASSSSASTSSNASQTVYMYGSKGSGVKKLQKMLQKLGYELEADGEFGRITDWCIRDFQTTYGLTVDGEAGPKTLAKLKQLTGKK